MAEHERIQKLVETLTSCLAELDELGAEIAAAHADAALQAFRRRYNLPVKPSDTD